MPPIFHAAAGLLWTLSAAGLETETKDRVADRATDAPRRAATVAADLTTAERNILLLLLLLARHTRQKEKTTRWLFVESAGGGGVVASCVGGGRRLQKRSESNLKPDVSQSVNPQIWMELRQVGLVMINFSPAAGRWERYDMGGTGQFARELGPPTAGR